VHTDREFTVHMLDIMIKNKNQKICKLIDVAISAHNNVLQKVAEKKWNTIGFGQR